MQYSKEFRFQCVEWFIQEDYDVASFQRRYRREMRANHHPVAPDAKSIKAWLAKSRQGEGTKNMKKTRTKVFCVFFCFFLIFVQHVRTPAKTAEVVGMFRVFPHASQRWIANMEDMPSRRSIQRILKDAKFHPYKLQLHQELKEIHCEKRVLHSIAMLDLIDESEFLDNVMFSDEAHFHQHGGVNRLAVIS